MNLKSFALIVASVCMLSVNSFAQKKKAPKQEEPQGYVFTTVVENPVTSIKNQNSSGTCWCFSALSFFESEIIKAGGPQDIDLSEMFVVSHAYADKAEKYVRLHGVLNFGPGSSFGDALYVMKHYGMVPNSEMVGLNYGTEGHVHGEMDAVTEAYVKAVVKNPNRKLTTAWHKGFQGILDAYLGERPEKFVVAGVEHTPKSYMESLPINLDDYVDIVSWSHIPYYEETIQEVPDNWRWEKAYNVPLDDMMAIIDNALNNGYTLAWASDVSEKGFTRDGIGVVPDTEAIKKAAGSDEARWIGADPRNASKAVATPGPELKITPEMRQAGYDNYQTTDDHGMHMYGIAKDQNGTKYYIIKNSWGASGTYKGVWYVSESFVRYKTMDVLVNKNAIPQEIRAKLGL
ncbi:MAG: aminopeptidase [Bacteroidales bacterium]|nr:aminopeptidase [Bacteroidales bacterium]